MTTWNERESMYLLLLGDADMPQATWLERWQQSYPQVAACTFRAADAPEIWQRRLQDALDAIPDDAPLTVVAHGTACAAFAAWLFDCDIITQKRVAACILAAPWAEQWRSDGAVLDWRYARFPFATALVVGENDAACSESEAQEIARRIRAKCLVTPHQGRLNAPLNGWQWGMRLMQDMLLD